MAEWDLLDNARQVLSSIADCCETQRKMIRHIHDLEQQLLSTEQESFKAGDCWLGLS